MTNYLLSIDPSIKNTGFTLWEKIYKYDKNLNYWPTREYVYCEIHNDDNASLKIIKECKKCYENEIIWKPIFVKSYDFKRYSTKYEVSKSDSIYNNNFNFLIKFKIEKLIKCDIGSLFYNNNFDLIIERGTFHSKNGIGYETQEHLRGFISGQFNKLLTKNMLISNTEWWAYYEENYKEIQEILTHEIMNNFIKENNIKNININKKIYKKWIIYLKKELSFKLANYLKNNYNWEPIINNHDEADSLLIGWYYLNKENK